MTSLKLAGESGALDAAASVAEFQQQIAAMNDLMRQVAGDAAVSAGSLNQADPLSAPFTLHVNPYTGSDKFVGGSYNSHESGATDEEIIASKLKRIEKQRLVCGYTPQRPFKTINRAVIEAAIITSKNWYTYTDPRAHVDCVSIVLAPAVHVLHNDPGSSSTSLPSWGTAKDPTIAELVAFNPANVGGVLLPRGVSLCGPDLRKTTIRPTWVPAAADEAADYSNRRGMLKITGTGYFFGFTVMDKVGEKRSHHLLDAFHFASKAELDPFYAKCFSAVGTGADLAAALTVTRSTEFEIVGPIDIADSPRPEWDTTASASPYIFNCSIRSDYGLGGAFMDGAKVKGLKSMVCANFTGVSLQKDMSSWQRYVNGNWTTTTYAQYIATDPDSIRMNPARLSRHISAINNCFIQEVSVFAIGQGVHHFTDTGGEITVTNSNSSFGGCAAISRGYNTIAFPQDRNWTVGRLRVPVNLGEKVGNIRRIFLGTIDAITSTRITLASPLAIDETSSTIPALLLRDGYSLPANTKVWVENPTGDDWRADLTAAAWSGSNADRINIQAALSQSGTNDPVGTNPDTGVSLAIGKRVYIRRLVDTRSPNERRVSLQLNNTSSARIPERNFILQTDPDRSGGAISRVLAPGGAEVFAVSGTGVGPAAGAGVAKTAEVTIRRSAGSVNYANSTFFRAGTVVKYAGKHYQSLRNQTTASAVPDPLTWGETFVHMPSDYNAEDVLRNESPILTIDTDTDANADTQTCGINFTTVWTSAGPVRDQYRSATDYVGVHAFLVALGLTATQAHTALLPRSAATRTLDPSNATDLPDAPSGGAATGRGNWAIEFRRPSVLRLFGHAWEWAGFLNYSKSIPAAQKDLSPQNKFTYYFTNDIGGRVVPQGSNEDGFNVSPKGLEDIETGATLTVDSIGSSTLDDFQSTDFPNGLTASEITVDTLTINTSVQFPEVSAAKVDSLGPVRLADAFALRSTAAIGGTTDSQRNANINQEPDVVTIKALNYWKNENRLITARPGAQFIYIDPVNGRNISNIDTLFGAPPVTQVGADASSDRAAVAIRSLAAAANYANQAFGPTTTVEFRCGPGVYLDTGTITFSTVARIRAWDFSANAYLNDSVNGGTVEFATGNYRNIATQPIFLTRPSYSNSDDFGITQALPVHFIFKEAGGVTGVVWWGIMDTIIQSSVPDSFFASGGLNTAADSGNATNWRALAKSDNDNALNYYVREHIMKAGVPGKLYGHRAGVFISFEKTGNINNVSLGAVSPADPFLPGDDRAFDAVIRLSPQLVTISGLRLVGNCNFSSAVNTGAFSVIRYRPSGYTTASYQYTGFAVALIGARDEVGDSILVRFGTAGRTPGSSDANNTADYNHPWNHVSLLNNSLQVASSTGSASGSGWKTIGPSLESIIGQINGTRSNVARNWTQFRITSNGSGGFLGKFGLHDTTAGTDRRTHGALTPLSLFGFGRDTPSTILRVAGTGELPVVDYSGLGPGDVGEFVNFDTLNMRVRPYETGTDITTGRFHERRFVL
jgi:hypothetical protein